VGHEFIDDKSFHYALASLLAELRSSFGVTQEALAAELGVDQAAVSRVESGRRRLTVGEAFGWLEALGLSPKESAYKLQNLWEIHGERPPGFWAEGNNG